MLKPTDNQIRALARREADPKQALAFEPIARGPLVALLGLLLVGLVAVPLALVQIAGQLWSAVGNRKGAAR